MSWYDRYIVRIPGVQGGEPVIAGTRTPVRAIAELYYQVYPGNLEMVRSSLSHLDDTQIKAGLAYYEDNRSEIDGYIQEHLTILRKLQGS
jgi:uncharacterized protein (DUF433 family)